MMPSSPASIRRLVVLLALVAACGGSSGSGGSSTAPVDSRGPTARIHFPPDGCLTEAPQVTLVVEANDPSGVALVRVAGSPARLDSDGLWRISVGLEEGSNLLRVETLDTLGNREPSAALVSVSRGQARWIEPVSLAIDGAVGEAWVLDSAARALFRVDTDGDRRVVSSAEVGSGVSLRDPRDVELVPSQRAAVVTDRDAVVLVDLESGARRELSSPSLGSGPLPLDLHGVAVDLLRNRALVLDAGQASLLAVDLFSGQRSTVSSDTVGTGVSLSAPRRVALDIQRGRALVTLDASPSIVVVELASGNRSILPGSGPGFVAPLDLAVDLIRDHAFVTDPEAKAIFQVDLATGIRRIFSSREVGSGPDWQGPVGVALRLDGVPFVVDSALDALIDASFGDRRILSSVFVGTGPSFGSPHAFSVSRGALQEVLVAEATELYRVDASGVRELLSGTQAGDGVPFGSIAAALVSRGPQACITVLDSDPPGVFVVDPVSGFRRRAAGGGSGSGPAFTNPRCMALEPSVVACSQAVYVADERPGEPAALLRVHLFTGARSILSDATHGLGPDLLDPCAIEFVLTPLSALAHVLDARQRAILSVDLFTGDRALVRELPPFQGTLLDMAYAGEQVLLLVSDPPAILLLRDQMATVLCDERVGAGPLLARPLAFDVLPYSSLGSIAHVLDAAHGAVLAVDTLRGERLILSK